MRIGFGTLALACVVLGPVVARAETFNITGNGQTISFTLPDSPTPTTYQTGLAFLIDDVAVDYNGTTHLTDVGFGVAPGPVLFIGDGESLSTTVENGGNPSWGFFTGDATLYTGTESAPTFTDNSFTLTNLEDPSNGGTPTGTYTLTVNPSASGTTVTPEPASFMLLGTGLAGVLGVARRRRAA